MGRNKKQIIAKTNAIEKLIRKKCKQMKIPAASIEVKRGIELKKQELENSTAVDETGNGDEEVIEKWLEENPSKICREITLRKILATIDDLTLQPENKAVSQCNARTHSDSDIFWNSPTVILRSIKHSLLKRNYSNITHLLLLLLTHKQFYLPVVQNVCQFIGTFNPLVSEHLLQDQFKLLKMKHKEE